MMNKFNLNFVTFFGIGNIKFAPGTFASALVCFLFYFLTIYMPYSFWLFLIIFFSILLYAPFAINKTLKNFINDEPDQIVNQENFSNAEGLISATFEIITFMAWAPAPNQPKPKSLGLVLNSCAPPLPPLV